MRPRTQDIPLPASKRQIDRAGDLVREYWTDPGIALEGEYMEAARLVYAFRLGFQDPLNRITMGVRSMVTSEGAPIVVAQRLKRLPTIVGKLARLDRMKLCRMQDIGGCRAILPARPQVDGVVHRIEANWDIKRFDDYTNEPKPTGYRAVHVVVERLGRQIEIQLRTPAQQRWAAEVDRAGGQLGVFLKDGQGPPELVAAFAEVAAELPLLGDVRDLAALDALFVPLRAKVREFAGARPPRPEVE